MLWHAIAKKKHVSFNSLLILVLINRCDDVV